MQKHIIQTSAYSPLMDLFFLEPAGQMRDSIMCFVILTRHLLQQLAQAGIQVRAGISVYVGLK